MSRVNENDWAKCLCQDFVHLHWHPNYLYLVKGLEIFEECWTFRLFNGGLTAHHIIKIHEMSFMCAQDLLNCMQPMA